MRVQGEGPEAVLVPDPDAQAVIALILRLRSEGVTLQGVADQLNAEGHRGLKGGRWHENSVRRVLAREKGADDE
jgi:hypothetical protein